MRKLIAIVFAIVVVSAVGHQVYQLVAGSRVAAQEKDAPAQIKLACPCI